MDTDRLEASQPDEATTSGEGEAQDEQPSPLHEMFRSVLDRVATQTSERPLVALAAAGAVGYIVGGGLPRWRMLGLLGVGGLVGYGITLVRARMTAGASGDGSEADATADAADEEAFATTPVPPTSGPPRRKKKKQDASTAG